MRKVIYFFAAFLLIFSLTNCKVLPSNDDEFYYHKTSSLQDLEFDNLENLEK